jgi:hypothetical protein
VAGECLLSHKFLEFGGSFCSNPWSLVPSSGSMVCWHWKHSSWGSMQTCQELSHAEDTPKAAGGGWITLEGVLLNIQS